MENGEPLMKPLISTIFGQVYLRRGEIVGSYHFDSPDDCYISYVNAPGRVLGNGEKTPEKKPFLDPKYDEKSRTFTGKIDWTDSGGFDGADKWIFKMVFQDDFSIICGGEIN